MNLFQFQFVIFICCGIANYVNLVHGATPRLFNIKRNITLVVTMCDLQQGQTETTGLRKGSRLHAYSRQHNQLMTLLKSLITTWNNAPLNDDVLNFIVLSNTQRGINMIQDEVNSWRLEHTSFLKMSYRPAIYPVGFEWQEGLFSPCASLKMFLPYILEDVQKIIYLDTDLIFFRDVRDLWNSFDSFSEETIMAAAPGIGKTGTVCLRKILKSIPNPPKMKGQRRNTGVLVMDLAKFRQTNWMNWLSYMSEYKEMLFECPDGAVFNIFFYENPGKLMRLQNTWNFFPLYFGNEIVPGQRISALHGVSGSLFHKGTVGSTIYSQYSKIELREEVDMNEFISKLRNAIVVFSERKCLRRHGQFNCKAVSTNIAAGVTGYT